MKHFWVIATILLAGFSATPATAGSHDNNRWTVRVPTNDPGNHRQHHGQRPDTDWMAGNDYRGGHDRGHGRSWHRPLGERSARWVREVTYRPDWRMQPDRYRPQWRHDHRCDRRPKVWVPAQWTIVYRFPW